MATEGGTVEEQHRTGIHVEARGMTNVFRVEVVGKKGRATMFCRSWNDAVEVARAWAAELDAPRGVL